MAVGYTKLFSEIIMSTVWREPDHVRLLWITMLALKDRWHIVNASMPGLADSARITLEQCQEAIRVLSEPDPYSRTLENEGRRIAKCDGGFVILNGEKYRNKMSLDERREYQRIKQREYRERESIVKSCQQNSQQLTHTDTDTQSDTYTKQKTTNGQNKFDLFWDTYPRKVKKKTSSDIWKRRKLDSQSELILADIQNRIKNHSPWKEGFIPHPTTYLNGELWNDEIQASDTKPEKKQVIIPNKDDHQAIDRLGRQLGIAAKGGEDYWTYRQRLIEAQK